VILIIFLTISCLKITKVEPPPEPSNIVMYVYHNGNTYQIDVQTYLVMSSGILVIKTVDKKTYHFFDNYLIEEKTVEDQKKTIIKVRFYGNDYVFD
jgi:hypothetical protein